MLELIYKLVIHIFLSSGELLKMINWQTVAQIISIGLIGLAGPIIIVAISFKGGENL